MTEKAYYTHTLPVVEHHCSDKLQARICVQWRFRGCNRSQIRREVCLMLVHACCCVLWFCNVGLWFGTRKRLDLTMDVRYPFRPLDSTVREVNYGNTVLVQRENAVWWLGYIQDIDNDQIYVDFDSSVIGACWVPSCNVWPHRFIDERLPRQFTVQHFSTPLQEGIQSIPTGTFAVQIALRDENNGPYKFRSANLVSGSSLYGLYCGKLDVESVTLAAAAGGEAAVGESARYVVVHRWQIVAKLPLDESSLFNKSTGQIYRKHVVQLTTDHNHPVEVVDAYSMYKCLLEARAKMPGSCHPLDSRSIDYRHYRFFAKISVDSVRFLCAEFHNDAVARSMCWNTDPLQQICEKFNAGLLGVSTAPAQQIGMVPSLAGDSGNEARDLSLSDLRHLLLMDVLYQLDLYAQTKIQRVSSQWYSILTGFAASLHITIDAKVQETERRHLDNDDTNLRPWAGYKLGMQCHYTYKLGWILNRTVTTDTRTLTITNCGLSAFEKKTEIIAEILKLKNAKLRMILVKDCRSRFGIGQSSCHLDHPGIQYNCGELSMLIDYCNLLVVEKYTISNILWFTSEIFLLRNGAETNWPVNEGRYVRSESVGCICGEQSLRVFIPRLRFRSTDSASQMLRNLLFAAENNCRPVTKTTLDKVKSIHNRWVQTFANTMASNRMVLRKGGAASI